MYFFSRWWFFVEPRSLLKTIKEPSFFCVQDVHHDVLFDVFLCGSRGLNDEHMVCVCVCVVPTSSSTTLQELFIRRLKEAEQALNV